jgi:hypothetical protein
MLNNDIYKKLRKDFESSFNPHMAENPVHLNKLRLLREYLDSKGLRMPKPKWKFDYNDFTTWSELPGRMIKDEQGIPIRHKPTINHSFKFKHLL